MKKQILPVKNGNALQKVRKNVFFLSLFDGFREKWNAKKQLLAEVRSAGADEFSGTVKKALDAGVSVCRIFGNALSNENLKKKYGNMLKEEIAYAIVMQMKEKSDTDIYKCFLALSGKADAAFVLRWLVLRNSERMPQVAAIVHGIEGKRPEYKSLILEAVKNVMCIHPKIAELYPEELVKYINRLHHANSYPPPQAPTDRWFVKKIRARTA